MSNRPKSGPYASAWRRHRRRLYAAFLPILTMLPISLLLVRFLPQATRQYAVLALLYLYAAPAFFLLLKRAMSLHCPRCNQTFSGKRLTVRESFSWKEATTERSQRCANCGLPFGALSDEDPGPTPYRGRPATGMILLRSSCMVAGVLKGCVLGIWLANALIEWKPLEMVAPFAQGMDRVATALGGGAALFSLAMVFKLRRGAAPNAMKLRASAFGLLGMWAVGAFAVLGKVAVYIIVPIYRGQITLMQWIDWLDLKQIATTLLLSAVQVALLGWLSDAALRTMVAARPKHASAIT